MPHTEEAPKLTTASEIAGGRALDNGQNLNRPISTPDGFENSSVPPGFTAGRSLFYDPLNGPHRLGDIRFELEKKLAACVATGGTNGYPIQPHRIKNPCFSSLVRCGMIFSDWSWKDLTECESPLEGAAALVLLATLERPVWGQGDYLLLETLERMEQLQSSARGSGRTL